MDQICDKKNKEDTWIEHLSLQEAMNQLSGREYHIIEKRFLRENTDRSCRRNQHLAGSGEPP